MLFIKSYFIKAESYKFDKYLKNHYDFGHARKIKNFNVLQGKDKFVENNYGIESKPDNEF